MATTRIISMHRNKGKTIAQCLKDRTDYVKNPDKTNQGELISSYECDIRSVDAEFMLAKREYLAITGRKQKNDVIAYQVRQSFKPGEITAEDANCLGYELAMRFLKGQHAFIVATHNDKKHIHNHIIWNSTSLDCTRKFRDFLGSGKAVARLSDLICLEHQLSVVPESKGHGQSYNKWLGNEKSPSHRELIRRVIDDSMAQNPDNLDALLTLLQAAGWEVKRGKHISLRGPGQTRYIRLKSLGDGYDEDSLRKALSTRTKNNIFSKKQGHNIPRGQFNMLIDIQAKLQSGKGGGYERWAKVFNLKQMAQTLNYLSENNLSNFDSLAEKTSITTKRHHEVLDEIKAIEKRMTEISQLRTHVRNYLKTKDTYVAYRKAGYSKRFAIEHQDEIQLHKAAKKAFDNLGTKQMSFSLFTECRHAVIRNLRMMSPQIDGTSVNTESMSAAALVAVCGQSLLENCAVFGGHIKSNKNYAAGLAAVTEDSVLLHLFNSARIEIELPGDVMMNGGGIVANMNGFMAYCANEGNVSATHLTGGLMGFAPKASIWRCINSDIVHGAVFIGEFPPGAFFQTIGNYYLSDCVFTQGSAARAGSVFDSGCISSIRMIAPDALQNREAISPLGVLEGENAQWLLQDINANGPLPSGIRTLKGYRPGGDGSD